MIYTKGVKRAKKRSAIRCLELRGLCELGVSPEVNRLDGSIKRGGRRERNSGFFAPSAASAFKLVSRGCLELRCLCFLRVNLLNLAWVMRSKVERLDLKMLQNSRARTNTLRSTRSTPVTWLPTGRAAPCVRPRPRTSLTTGANPDGSTQGRALQVSQPKAYSLSPPAYTA